ncbi:MAG: L,D-transpeptidase family protein [Hyphomicrobiaceae bacterium]
MRLIVDCEPEPTRRSALALLTAGASALLGAPALAKRFTPERRLRPGEFVWQPERSPTGAVVMIVSLPEQMVHVYRGGVEIGISTCSTGRAGHRTPTGVFTILEKQRQHVSSLYKGAQMPNMERLTWTGIALHAGNLPGYPASHGCVRLPLRFSSLLYEVTHLGVTVIIADERTQPANVVHPGPMLSRVAEVESRSVVEHVSKKKPHGAWDAEVHYPVTSVVVSRADGKAYIAEDGRLRAAYPVAFRNPETPLGTHVYSLLGPAADGSGLTWLAFGVGKSHREAHIVKWQGDAAMRRIVFRDTQRAMQIARSFHPGSTVVLTDASAPHSTRRTPGNFSVIASDRAS